MFSVWVDDVKIPAAIEWLNPFGVSGLTNIFLDLSYYLSHGGTAMLASYAAVIGGLVLLFGGGALLMAWRSRLNQQGLRLLMVLLVMSLPSFALEHRHSEFVTVGANETVDDTLVAAGNTVRVEGIINGDLIAFGRNIEVRGTVKGDIVSFARSIVVSGNVEGHIYTCSRSLDLEGQLGHSIYGWMQSLRVDSRGRVGDGIVAGAGDVTLEGEVKRGVNLFAGNADVSGSIGRDLTMAGGTLTLSNTARVGGNLTARVHQLKDVQIAEGATIGGKRDIQVRVRKSRFARPGFYFIQAIWLASAMLVGWLGITLFPRFFEACTQAAGAGWRSLGIGIGVLAGVPVAMIVVAITLVGLPLSLMLLAAYLTAIFLAKIWVGAFLGRLILKPATFTKHDWLLSLLVGLLMILIVSFIPFLGGLVRFGVVCLGLGAFAWQLYHTLRPATTAG